MRMDVMYKGPHNQYNYITLVPVTACSTNYYDITLISLKIYVHVSILMYI